MRKTKIVCTLGPATDSEEVMRKLIENGMDVARFNFSHGTHADHKRRMQMLRKLRNEYDLPVAALLDTKGPEIRIGTFSEGRVSLQKGQTFTLTTLPCEGTREMVSVSYENFTKDVSEGSTVLIDDGLLELKVQEVTQTQAVCTVCNDAVISDRKGVNLPNVHLSMPYISKKDAEDIAFGVKMGFDFIAASFVRSAEDVREVRELLRENKCDFINIIAKIENMEGVENIDAIIEEADGIMIARGDMGVEIPLEEVPVIQKMIIKKVYNAGKQVITATQMLDSMMKNPRPTRAEATDVANAIYDGTSAIMLSGETAAGAYPIESLRTMVRIAHRTEKDIDYRKRFFNSGIRVKSKMTEAISHAACTTAYDLQAKAIIALSKSGKTVRKISKYRPGINILGCSTSPHVCRQLNLSWGVTPMLVREEDDIFEMFDHAMRAAEEKKLLKEGDIAIITTGVPLGRAGTTNLIKVQIAGEQSY